MAMRAKVLTDNEIQENFNKALEDAIDTGNHPSDGMGFTNEIINALTAVAQQYPNVEASSIQNARQAWRRYASGAVFAERARSLETFYPTRGDSTGDSLA
jgi:hypothetical protein